MAGVGLLFALLFDFHLIFDALPSDLGVLVHLVGAPGKAPPFSGKALQLHVRP